MAVPWLFALAITVAIWVTVAAARAVVQRIKNARFAAAKGCRPPAPLPQNLRSLGLGLLREQQRAAREHRMLALFQKRFDICGNTFSAVLPGRRFICTIEPENVRAILSTNFRDFSVAGSRVRAFGPLLGSNGVFIADGAAWEHSRALLRPSFSRDRIADLESLEVHIVHLLNLLPSDESIAVDLQPLFFCFTLDSATEFLFGESVNALLTDLNSHGMNFAEVFDYVQVEMVKRFRLGPFLPFYYNPRFHQYCRTAHAFVDSYVAKALARRHEVDEKNASDPKAGKYIFLDEAAKETQDLVELRFAALNVLLAGRDTTASLLGNAFYVLSQRPDIWEKVKAEVDNNLGGEKPTYEVLRDLKYVKYVLNETLRLYPVIPANARLASCNTVLPLGGGPDGKSPVFVAKGDVVSYLPYSMHRRRDIFGADAEEFRPERWETLRANWAYLPFNGGPRICLGQQYALTEAMYAVTRFAQEFEGLEYKGKPYKEKLSLSLTNLDGVKVVLKRRV